MSEQYKITGVVETVLPTQTFDSGFTKRVIVINTGGEYPQHVPIEFVKDKVSVLDAFHNGTPVTVYFNVRGNEYNGKYYVNLVGWKIESPAMTQMATPQPAPQKITPMPTGDEIPF